ncbi:Clavaminate synthase-like protein [Aspergillus ellipticus CBS 707.79]|uniref:Clavaminate synthase-like protein n=1 Tax=Aspergillus ellipticus CBS 707.79 TaxID=1448320 RepID=A0A319E1T7_9EURO|nr:Clavaminate synthase-like protein [Aspergillus ellipticus CBS 707.79]
MPLTVEDPDPKAMEKLVNGLRDACSRVGFFIIKNHGIDWAIVERAFAGLKEFFALPMDEKMKVHQSLSPSYMGYEEPYYTNVDRLSKGGLDTDCNHNRMTTGYEPELDSEGTGFQPEVLLRLNSWPDDTDSPFFKPAMREYRAACLSLMRKLTRTMANVMGIDESFFVKKYTYPVAGIRGLYYPPQAPDDEQSTGLGAHTDVQFMTMIAQDPLNIESLEALNASGHWIKPKLQPQTFVVNLGDMMARLTNDVFLSTVHRVRNQTGRERYSLPFFFGLNNDELISPLPQFITPENPIRDGYETGITSFEHYNRRMQRAHHKHYTATDKMSTALPKWMTRIDGVLVEGL